MDNILDEILKHKRSEIERLKKDTPLEALKKEVEALPEKKPSFHAALKRAAGLVVIAEIKKKSPSKGLLREDFDPAAIARAYEEAGASAISVLTDERFFGGSAAHLAEARKAVKLPILRKDFILDEYQVYESRLMGADAILLIVSVLPLYSLRKLAYTAIELGLDVLFEVHSGKDIEKIATFRPQMIGINNRDLKTFRVSLRVTERLIADLPKKTFVISESGIQTKKDLAYLKSLGVRAVLMGEAFMRAEDPGKALAKLLEPSIGSR